MSIMDVVNRLMSETTRPKVDLKLIFRIKEDYPETRLKSTTGVVEWALKKLIEDARPEGDYRKEGEQSGRT